MRSLPPRALARGGEGSGLGVYSLLFRPAAEVAATPTTPTPPAASRGSEIWRSDPYFPAFIAFSIRRCSTYQ